VILETVTPLPGERYWNNGSTQWPLGNGHGLNCQTLCVGADPGPFSEQTALDALRHMHRLARQLCFATLWLRGTGCALGPVVVLQFLILARKNDHARWNWECYGKRRLGKVDPHGYCRRADGPWDTAVATPNGF
jgi:hypothetical protein